MQRHTINQSAPNTFSVIDSISRTIASNFTKLFNPGFFGKSDENIFINNDTGIRRLNKRSASGRKITSKYQIPNVVDITNPPWMYIEPKIGFDQRDTTLGEVSAHQVNSMFPIPNEEGTLHSKQCIFYDAEMDVRIFVSYYTVKLTLEIEIMLQNVIEQRNQIMHLINNVRVGYPAVPCPMYGEGELPTSMLQMLKGFKDYVNGSELTDVEFTEYLMIKSGNIISQKMAKKRENILEYYQYYEHPDSLYVVPDSFEAGDPEREGQTYTKAPINFQVITEQPIPSGYTIEYPHDIHGLATPDKLYTPTYKNDDGMDKRINRVVTIDKERTYNFIGKNFIPFYKNELYCDTAELYDLPLPLIMSKEHIIALRYLKRHHRDIGKFYQIQVFENNRQLPNKNIFTATEASDGEWFLDLDNLRLTLSNSTIKASYTVICYYHKKSVPDLITAMNGYYEKHKDGLQTEIDNY